jgi:hypothetical protein
VAQPIRVDDPASNRAELPVACSLQASEGTDRLARWRTLFESSPPTVRRKPDQIAVRVAESPGVAAELEALVREERACCSFVQWHVVHDAGWHELQIQGTTEGLDAIAALFGGE